MFAAPGPSRAIALHLALQRGMRARRGARRLGTIALLAASIAGGANRAAAEWTPDLPDWAPQLSFRGFGTLGVVHSSEDQADFVGNQFQPNGAGNYRRWDFGVDSKLGLQMDVRFNAQLTAVVQIVAQHQYDNQYWPAIEWANLKYEPTPGLFVRLGRTASSHFMVSGTRLVGFSYPWVRPPLEVYGLVPLTSRDGIDVGYQVHAGAWTHELALAFGLSSAKLSGDGKVDAEPYFEINDTVTRGPFTLRAGFSFTSLTISNDTFDGLFDGLTEFGDALSAIPPFAVSGAQALALTEKYEVDSSFGSLIALGAMYDPGTWLVMAEFAHQMASSAVSDATAWYITAGYRFGDVTPFVSFAQLYGDPPEPSRISTAGLPPPLAQAAAGLNGGLEGLANGLNPSQSTLSAGVRWDVCSNVAVKLQYDRVNLGTGSAGRLMNLQPDFRPGGSVDLFTFTLDFVF